MAIVTWIVPHLFSFILLARKSNLYCYLIFIIFLSPLYLNNISLGDIKRNYLNDLLSQNFEFGFIFINALLLDIGLNNSLIIKIYQLIFIFTNIFMFKYFFNTSNYLFIIAILFSSPYFFLGYHNVLRQGLSSTLIIISILFLLDKKFLFSSTTIFIAQSLHFSTFIIFFICLFALFFYRNKFITKNNIFKHIILVFVSITIFYLIFDYFSSFLIYAQRNNDRFIGLLKPIIILITYLIATFFYLKRGIDSKFNYFMILRFIFYTMFFAMSVNPTLVEVASRILFFCFFLELIIIIYSLKYGSLYNKCGSVISLTSYGFALNIITLLNEIKI